MVIFQPWGAPQSSPQPLCLRSGHRGGGGGEGRRAFSNWFWQLPKPIWEPRAQKHFGVGPSRGLASPAGQHTTTAPHPLAHLQRELKAAWASGGDQSVVSPYRQAGGACSFWNSALDKCPPLSAPPEWKGRASGTGNWVLPGPACLLLLRPLESARPAAALPAPSVGLAPGGLSLQLPQSELGTKAWAALHPSPARPREEDPGQDWSPEDLKLEACPCLESPMGRAAFWSRSNSPTPKSQASPFPILAEMI